MMPMMHTHVQVTSANHCSHQQWLRVQAVTARQWELPAAGRCHDADPCSTRGVSPRRQAELA